MLVGERRRRVGGERGGEEEEGEGGVRGVERGRVGRGEEGSGRGE